MKVYISGALMGSNNLEKSKRLYESFFNVCKSLGLDPYLPHKNTDPKNNSELDPVEVYKRDIEQLTNSDIVVAYIGTPSLGVGAEMSIAVNQNKRIIALFEEENPRVSRFLRGLLLTVNNTTLVSYGSDYDANQKLRQELLNLSKYDNSEAYNTAFL